MAKSKLNKEKVVVCSYKPKSGKKEELLELLEDHVPTLRSLGFVSAYPRSLLMSEEGCILEIFAWESEEAAKVAFEHSEVKRIREKIEALAEIIPLSSLVETKKKFAQFSQLPNSRADRPMWFEIPAENPSRCLKFYEKVFGWQGNSFGEDGDYWVVDTGKEPIPGINGGITKRQHSNETVRNTVCVDSVDAYIQKIESAGGKITVPKTKIVNIGYIAYAKDPEGNTFGVIEPIRPF